MNRSPARRIAFASIATLVLTACPGLELPRPAAPAGDAEPTGHDDAATEPDAAAADDDDAGPPGDDAATEPDAASLSPDATPAADAGPPPMPCGFDVAGPADGDRLVLIGEPYTATPGVDGHTLRVLTLSAQGTLAPTTTRVDLGFRPARAEIVPSGALAVVLGEDGELATVLIRSATDLAVADVEQLPSASYGDLRLLPDGQTVIVAGSNSTADSGLSTVSIGCDGALTVDGAAFYALRLTASLAFLDAARTRAVVLGGQAVFAPVDRDDLRIFARSGGRWSQVAAFDLWTDAVDALRIAVSPDGRTLIVPNGSPFSAEGGRVMVASVAGDVISGPRLLTNMGDAREAHFSPDGQTALVTLLEGGAVVALADRGQGWAETQRITGVGLAEQLAMVTRGALAGRVLLPSVDPRGGPNVAQLQIDGPGRLRDLGQVELGSGSANIPGAIAVTP